MPDPKKRLCPECAKEFQVEEDQSHTPCCQFPIRAYDDRKRLSAVETREREAEETERKKKEAEKKPKKGALGNLAEL